MDSINTLPLVALYAETHFKFFKGFPSLLFQRQPEVFFDMPRRVCGNGDIPLLLLINDVDIFPSAVIEVAVSASYTTNHTIVFSDHTLDRYLLSHPFEHRCHVYLFPIPTQNLPKTLIQFNCTAVLKKGSKRQIVLNDNLIGSSKSPFSCTLTDQSFAGAQLCAYGDLHVHTQHSRSHVEFGPPIAALDACAYRFGISCIGITDHSYDLSCSVTNYLAEDSTLENWQSLKKEVENPHANFRSCFLLGEEISVSNKAKNIVHLGALGISEFIPGTRDGGRIHHKQSSLSIDQAIEEIHRQKGIAFAAHPAAASGWMQRLFLHRGHWSIDDITDSLDAFQAVNNGFTLSWYRARKLWIQRLLQQQRLPLIAGNDTHGDFNRYRCLNIPFLSVYEDFNRYLGSTRTGFYGLRPPLTQHQILTCLKNGQTFITAGPFLGLYDSQRLTTSLIHSKLIVRDRSNIFIYAMSTDEFGPLS
ncbi:MAG: hypothetical protein JW795_01485, partial [Chitinivibrionales bacterium]|nr:hypothetical protein [Chitinivibrionales bacterium]